MVEGVAQRVAQRVKRNSAFDKTKLQFLSVLEARLMPFPAFERLPKIAKSL
jgi:hypothetical protein